MNGVYLLSDKPLPPELAASRPVRNAEWTKLSGGDTLITGCKVCVDGEVVVQRRFEPPKWLRRGDSVTVTGIVLEHSET